MGASFFGVLVYYIPPQNPILIIRALAFGLIRVERAASKASPHEGSGLGILEFGLFVP